MMHNRYISWIVHSSLELSFVPFLRQCSGVNSEMKFVCRFVRSWLLRLIHNFKSVSASWIFQCHRIAMRTLKYSSAVSTLINESKKSYWDSLMANTQFRITWAKNICGLHSDWDKLRNQKIVSKASCPGAWIEKLNIFGYKGAVQVVPVLFLYIDTV